MERLSELSLIANTPDCPMELFKEFLKCAQEHTNFSLVTMNLATVNKEHGVSNRTLVYRGLLDSDIVVVTERASMKYEEIFEDPRIAATFCFIYNNKDNEPITRQIRITGKAIELSSDQIEKLWQEEPFTAKIRSHLCECGKPIDWKELKSKHDSLLEKNKKGEEKLEQTKSYTAFRIVAECIDFYHCEKDSIADRVIYRRCGNSWKMEHVCA